MQIGRAEIVAPLTDAVRLIDGYEAHVDAAELHLEELRRDAFRRHIQYLGVAHDAVVERRHRLAACHTRIDGCRNDATPPQGHDLVLHEGYERRYDDAHALLGKGRHLERERLAATRRHKPQRVVALGYAAYDVALDATKISVAPVVVQNLQIFFLVVARHGCFML